MVVLTRAGGRVAVQDVDADGPTVAPAALCHPAFPSLERLGAAYLSASLRRGSDSLAGRKSARPLPSGSPLQLDFGELTHSQRMSHLRCRFLSSRSPGAR